MASVNVSSFADLIGLYTLSELRCARARSILLSGCTIASLEYTIATLRSCHISYRFADLTVACMQFHRHARNAGTAGNTQHAKSDTSNKVPRAIRLASGFLCPRMPVLPTACPPSGARGSLWWCCFPSAVVMGEACASVTWGGGGRSAIACTLLPVATRSGLGRGARACHARPQDGGVWGRAELVLRERPVTQTMSQSPL